MSDASPGDLLDRIAEIARSADVPGVRLIGVDGPAGAGKSTLARSLSARFGWPVIEVDDFFSWVGFDGWWPRFRSEVIDPLIAGESARYRVRDWRGDEFGEGLADWKTLDWAPMVIIEGVGSTRSDISDLLACRVWVDAPEVERLRRGIARDGESHRQLWEDYLPREAEFFANDATASRAEVWIDGTARDS